MTFPCGTCRAFLHRAWNAGHHPDEGLQVPTTPPFKEYPPLLWTQSCWKPNDPIFCQECRHIILYYKVILKCQLLSLSTQFYDYISAWTEQFYPHHGFKKKICFFFIPGESNWSRNRMQSFVYRLVYVVPKYHNAGWYRSVLPTLRTIHPVYGSQHQLYRSCFADCILWGNFSIGFIDIEWLYKFWGQSGDWWIQYWHHTERERP